MSTGRDTGPVEGIFADLAPEDRCALDRLGVVRRYGRGAYLMLEGDRSDPVLLVQAGRLKIVRTTDDGRESVIAIRQPGDLVGELNALAGSDAPRTASVVAADDVTVRSIAARDLVTFIATRPAVSFAVMRQLAIRLREATSRHGDAAAYDVLHRVARILAEQAARLGRQTDGGVLVGASLTQRELSGLIPASPTSVARALAVLRAKGLVRTARRTIVITDLDGLRRFTR